MLSLSAAVRILLWSEPVDMRKGIDGLSMLVRNAGEDVHSGHLYVFMGRRRHQLRVLTWQRGGFVLVTKRLDTGTFTPPAMTTAGGRVELDGALLTMLVDGVNLRLLERQPVWVPGTRRKAG